MGKQVPEKVRLAAREIFQHCVGTGVDVEVVGGVILNRYNIRTLEEQGQVAEAVRGMAKQKVGGVLRQSGLGLMGTVIRAEYEIRERVSYMKYRVRSALNRRRD